MKIILRSILSALLVVFLSTGLCAQISISSSNIASLYTVGNQVTGASDTEAGGMYNIGQPGGGNTWDFSGVMLDSAFAQEVVEVAGTPGASIYTDANIALRAAFSNEEGDATLYNYLKLSSNALETSGLFTIGMVDGQAFELILEYEPENQVFPLPISYQDTWTFEGTLRTETKFGGMSFGSSQGDVSAASEVDAYGTLILPNGKTVQALRIKEVDMTESEIIPGFPSTDTSTTYTFVSQEGEIVSISSSEPNTPNQGTIQGSMSWTSFANVTSVNKLEDLGYKMNALIPNPVVDAATLQYTLPESEMIQIRLYDQKGQMVRKAFQGKLPSGQHSLSVSVIDLPSGIYYLSLQARGAALTEKLVVER